MLHVTNPDQPGHASKCYKLQKYTMSSRTTKAILPSPHSLALLMASKPTHPFVTRYKPPAKAVAQATNLAYNAASHIPWAATLVINATLLELIAMKLTLANATSILRAAGMVIRKTDGEYRVTAGTYTFPTYSTAQREAMAYYTTDLEDAVNTGQDMAVRLRNIPGSDSYTQSAARIASRVNGEG